MLGFSPCTLKRENPLEIGDCVAFDRIDASMGSERTLVELLELVEMGMEVSAEWLAGIAFVSEIPTFCPLPPEALSSRGGSDLKKIPCCRLVWIYHLVNHSSEVSSWLKIHLMNYHHLRLSLIQLFLVG